MIIYFLNKKQRVIKALDSRNMVEAKFVEGINQANQLTLSLPVNKRLNHKVVFALFKKPDANNYLMFKLNNENIQNDRITYTGIDAAYDELKSYGYVKENHPIKRTALEMLQDVLKGSRWEPGYVENTGVIETYFYYQNYLDAIQTIIKKFNLEVTFTYNFDTKYQKIVSRQVNLYLQQGRRTGKRFEYSSNLLEVTREEDSQEIYTALVGRGKGIEKEDEEGNTTGGYGRKITFSDVVWSKSKGDPVNKPAGQEFVEDPEATEAFGYDDGKPRTGIIVFDDIEDPEELLQATWTSLKTSERPKVSFKAKVTDVGNLQLGDTIAIIRHDLKIEYFTRVYKVTHDLNQKQNNTIEMGDDLSSNSLTSYITDISEVANLADQTATAAVSSASSKNKNIYSNVKPKLANEGDNLFLNLGNGEFEYWIWHNHQWEFVQSTQDLANVKQNVEEAQKDLINAKAEIVKNHEASNEAISSLNKTVTGLVAKVNDSVNKSQIEQLSNQINLKVSKGDIIGQLNIEAGSTLIQNKKLYFDSDSVVFSGKAFIPDAAITNISADKITAGTLDAGKINVININADNITAGTLSGPNINMDLTKGRVLFQAGRMFNTRESFDLNIDENYFMTASGATNYNSWINAPRTLFKNGAIYFQKWGLNDTEYKNYLKISSHFLDNSFLGGSDAVGITSDVPFVITTTNYENSSAWLNMAPFFGQQDYQGIIIDPTDLEHRPGVSIGGGKKSVFLVGGESYTSNSYGLDYTPQIEVGSNLLSNGNQGNRRDGIALTASRVVVMGDSFEVVGSKNAIVPTSQGMAAINAYETAEYYFGDIGKSKTDKNGQVLIQLDPLFLETINTDIPYHVFVSSYGNANIWVEQMDENSFLVKSNKPYIEFSWEIKAKRKGYEKDRLKISSKKIPEKLIPQYKEKGIL